MFILKQLRRKKNVSQTNLADTIGVSLRTIQLYEKKNANIPIKNLTKIAQYFDLTIAELYSYEVNEPNVLYETPKKILKKQNNVRVISSGKYLISVPFISGDIYEQYILEIENEKYINSLPYIDFVLDKIEEGNYFAFEIINNAMDNGKVNGFPNKTIVLGKQQAKKEFLEEYARIRYQVIVYKDTIAS